MMINGLVVSYNFGPKYDMDIRFSKSVENQTGLAYDKVQDHVKLTFQLLCHAVDQVQYVPRVDKPEGSGWTLDKIEQIQQWEFRDPKPGETLKDVIQKNGQVLTTSEMTYAKYELKDDGRLVLVLRESPDCDFLIDYFNLKDDVWLDDFLDYADAHSKRFGRIG